MYIIYVYSVLFNKYNERCANCDFVIRKIIFFQIIRKFIIIYKKCFIVIGLTKVYSN